MTIDSVSSGIFRAPYHYKQHPHSLCYHCSHHVTFQNVATLKLHWPAQSHTLPPLTPAPLGCPGGLLKGLATHGFPGEQQFPHSIPRTYMLLKKKKWGTNIFRTCSQALYKREREHTCKKDSQHRRAQKHGKGHFSIGDNAYYMTFKHHKCYSAACKSRKVSENTYRLCRKGKGGGESFTQRSTLT